LDTFFQTIIVLLFKAQRYSINEIFYIIILEIHGEKGAGADLVLEMTGT